MDALLLSRIQFELTIAFHYIYPPMSIGLGLLMVIMEAVYLKTGNPLYKDAVKFWARIFGLIFAIGVATGIVMEFQFGTNWARYSRFVGDVFGSALAAEGIFAFFLESGFLAILLFGWDKVGPKMHFFATLMVSLGSMFSAVWIVVANSWMQTPAGFHLVGEGVKMRAEVTDFWAVVFNPSSVDRLCHVLMGAWQAGAWLVISISAYYVLRNRHLDFAKFSLKIGLGLALVSSLLQLWTGHLSAKIVSRYQPAKMAAFEAHFEENAPAPYHLFGWVDEASEKVKYSVAIPGLLSFLIAGDKDAPVKGLRAFPKEEWPPVNLTFQSYHAMIGIGLYLILMSLAGFWWLRDGKIFRMKWMLRLFVFSVLGPQLANQLGWIAAEVGRQPWIVYGILRTRDGVSQNVHGPEVLISLVMFGIIYLLLFILFIFLLDQKIKKGPVDEVLSESQQRA
jgi:cytochrome d ubiquinol oxidase subunit I